MQGWIIVDWFVNHVGVHRGSNGGSSEGKEGTPGIAVALQIATADHHHQERPMAERALEEKMQLRGAVASACVCVCAGEVKVLDGS